MISRREFLMMVAAQSLLQTASAPKFLYKRQPILSEIGTSDFIILGGWVLLKSDLLERES